MPHLWCNNSRLPKGDGPTRFYCRYEFMWIEKLIDGVLELETPIGARYVRPNLAQRAYLMWTFRNFSSLPQQVLRPWERRLIERLRNENRFVAVPAIGTSVAPLIGRVERRVPAQVVSVSAGDSSIRKPASGKQATAPERRREAASA